MILLVIILFLEFQPPILFALHSLPAQPTSHEAGLIGLVAVAISKVNDYFKILGPIAGIVTWLAGRLSNIIKANSGSTARSALARKFASHTLLFFAAIIVPMLLWDFWLHIVLYATGVGAKCSQLSFQLQRWFGDGASFLHPWLVYLIVGMTILFFSYFLEPNANSLHRLYRDRLSASFLFERGSPSGARGQADESAQDGPKAYSLDRKKLSALNNADAPYLLINTALNIQHSSYVNQRGRNADFFLFSRDYVGSHATGYVRTETLENACPSLDLGTAMAISGAAASSDMGARSIRMLAPTLALLNVRLGYWMANPSFMKGVIDRSEPTKKARNFKVWSHLYLFAEMFALLDEDSDMVYLTDGGHIENLGVYELLKRRCRLIVVVDAEADPNLAFPSFVTLQRYARIDLGIRIEDTKTELIRARSRAYDAEAAAAKASGAACRETEGPHAALGRICYPDAPPGILLYVKSSLTGDENDLILSYKRNSPSFPHETTGDQFFSEAQFEAYRALGFHVLKRALSGEDRIAGLMDVFSDRDPTLKDAPTQAEKDKRKEAVHRIFADRSMTADGLMAFLRPKSSGNAAPGPSGRGAR